MNKAKKYRGENKISGIRQRVCAKCGKETITRKTYLRREHERKFAVLDVCYNCIPFGPLPNIATVTMLADKSELEVLDKKIETLEMLVYELGDMFELKLTKKEKK